MPQPEHEHHPSELTPAIEALAQTFIRRWDLYARQLADGRYLCVHAPLNHALLANHLLGKVTLGAYILDAHSQARYVVLDADDHTHWQRLHTLASKLAEQGVPAYREQSRRGGHVWLFFDQLVSGQAARAFVQGLLDRHHITDVEVFPKQARLTGGPGSLIRLPFGVHRRSGRRYGFLDEEGQPLAPNLRDQLTLLCRPATIPTQSVEAYQAAENSVMSRMKPPPSEAAQTPLSAPPEIASAPVSERVKASIDVRAFISAYVDLSPSGVGLCPFHDDHRPSFAVNDAEGYWNCFAGCGGGSIIDFWQRWRGCDFTTAVCELAAMLL